jgi:hypothetical protein
VTFSSPIDSQENLRSMCYFFCLLLCYCPALSCSRHYKLSFFFKFQDANNTKSVPHNSNCVEFEQFPFFVKKKRTLPLTQETAHTTLLQRSHKLVSSVVIKGRSVIRHQITPLFEICSFTIDQNNKSHIQT